jgi:hypothetical protein
VKPTEPLALHHSWPLFERRRHFDPGCVFSCPPTDSTLFSASQDDKQELARRGVGLWECDLSDNSLAWSDEVYDIFGLPRGANLRRDEAVALYAENSRAAMERLRAYAIKHRRGFTLDAEIRPSLTGSRWMRLIAAPVCDGDRVVRLHGLKQIV